MARETKADEDEFAERARRIEEEATAAVQEARLAYQMSGLPMVGWRNGQVVWVDPVTLQEVPRPEPVDDNELP